MPSGKSSFAGLVLCLFVADAVACSHERRQFSALFGAGAGGSADGYERPAAAASSEAPMAQLSGGAGDQASDEAGAASGAATEPPRASAGASGAPPAEPAQGGEQTGARGQATGSAGMAGVGGASRVASDDGGRSGGSTATPAAGGDGGTLGSSGSAGLAPTQAGAASGPQAELCVTDEGNVARLTLTAPAVAGDSARVQWSLPAPSEDYLVERYIAFDCDPTLAIDDGATLSISWGLTPQYGCTVQLAVHGRTWAALPDQWETECLYLSVEVSP
jgi:hypothetical protein